MVHSCPRLHTLLPPKGSPVVEPPLLVPVPVAESPEVVGAVSEVDEAFALVEASEDVAAVVPFDSEPPLSLLLLLPPLSPPQATTAKKTKDPEMCESDFMSLVIAVPAAIGRCGRARARGRSADACIGNLCVGSAPPTSREAFRCGLWGAACGLEYQMIAELADLDAEGRGEEPG
jgi:hypothetical protein